MLIVVVLLAYVALGLYMQRHMPINDFERDYLSLDHAMQAADYAKDFGQEMPARKPWRLPLEYWLYAWAPSLAYAREAALCVSTVGVWLAMQWGGPLAGLIIVSSPYVVSQLTAASYKAPVATLWIGGLYALHTGHPFIAGACGVTLALLRASSWGMALWLLWASGGIVLASGLAAYLWLQHPDVVRAQGWWRLLRGEACPVRGMPQDGWHYALRVLARRYEAWGAWLFMAGMTVMAGMNGHITWELSLTAQVIIISLCVLVVTHLPRALIRPKWVIGYVAEYALPVAVALAHILAP